ncbi:related to methyltransferase [Cephalotrichum gorgonifer]|uniref:Related to methyltransferase n=1 Tax=Cephalotrichum gorgonifer TaxID=2041049 RepID=A0AAE8MYC9_9PEZI|nr:related to methyltransferase [Cephalotrichum gorgonifer]
MGERHAKRLKRASVISVPDPEGDVDVTAAPMDVADDSDDDRRYAPGAGSEIAEESREGRTEATDDDASEGEADMMQESSPSEGQNGASSASIYAPSRLPRRFLETRPTFKVMGDSVMEEGSIDMAASTRSLMEQYLDYNEENGRRYCGTYFMPNDELEQTRMYLSHQVYLHMFKGAPTTVALEDPKLILDIGTGTGDWAIQIGEMYPKCEVVGTDISAIQSTCPPYNVFFEIEDAELPWLRQPDSIDLVHMRNLTGAFRDWRFIYEQAFESLRPGGWLELHEFDDGDNWRTFFSSFPPESPVHALARDLYLASIKAGRPRGIQHMEEGYLVEAGFVDIETKVFEIPITVETGSAGKIWLISVVDGLEALCLRPLTKYMGWDPDHAKRCCEEAAHSLARFAKDPEKAKGLTAKVRVVTGRKPESPEAWEEYNAHYLQDRDARTETASGSVMTSDTSVPAESTPAGSIAEGVAKARVGPRAAELGLGSNGEPAEKAS